MESNSQAIALRQSENRIVDPQNPSENTDPRQRTILEAIGKLGSWTRLQFQGAVLGFQQLQISGENLKIGVEQSLKKLEEVDESLELHKNTIFEMANAFGDIFPRVRALESRDMEVETEMTEKWKKSFHNTQKAQEDLEKHFQEKLDNLERNMSNKVFQRPNSNFASNIDMELKLKALEEKFELKLEAMTEKFNTNINDLKLGAERVEKKMTDQNLNFANQIDNLEKLMRTNQGLLKDTNNNLNTQTDARKTFKKELDTLKGQNNKRLTELEDMKANVFQRLLVLEEDVDKLKAIDVITPIKGTDKKKLNELHHEMKELGGKLAEKVETLERLVTEKVTMDDCMTKIKEKLIKPIQITVTELEENMETLRTEVEECEIKVGENKELSNYSKELSSEVKSGLFKELEVIKEEMGRAIKEMSQPIDKSLIADFESLRKEVNKISTKTEDFLNIKYKVQAHPNDVLHNTIGILKEKLERIGQGANEKVEKLGHQATDGYNRLRERMDNLEKANPADKYDRELFKIFEEGINRLNEKFNDFELRVEDRFNYIATNKFIPSKAPTESLEGKQILYRLGSERGEVVPPEKVQYDLKGGLKTDYIPPRKEVEEIKQGEAVTKKPASPQQQSKPQPQSKSQPPTQIKKEKSNVCWWGKKCYHNKCKFAHPEGKSTNQSFFRDTNYNNRGTQGNGWRTVNQKGNREYRNEESQRRWRQKSAKDDVRSLVSKLSEIFNN